MSRDQFRQSVTFHKPLRSCKLRILPTAPSQIAAAVADLANSRTQAPAATGSPSLPGTGSVPPASAIDPERVRAEQATAILGLLQDIADRVAEFESNRAQSLHEMQTATVQLAVAVASHILRRELDEGSFHLNDLVESAISKLASPGNIVIHMNYEDHTAISEHVADGLQQLAEKVAVVTDNKLSRGACRVTADGTGWLRDFGVQLATLQENLLKGIAYAQAERRESPERQSSLRRFPERRNTA